MLLDAFLYLLHGQKIREILGDVEVPKEDSETVVKAGWLACLLSNLGGFPDRTLGCEEKVDPGESGSGCLAS